MKNWMNLEFGINERRSFVVFRNPGEELVHFLLLGKPSDEATDSCFAVSGFSDSAPIFYPVEQRSDIKSDDFINGHTIDFKFTYERLEEINGTEPITYHKLVRKAIDEIRANRLTKVVAAQQQFDPESGPEPMALLRVLMNDDQAFVYFFHDPVRGSWAGASPEFLLKKRGNQMSCMALAGTRLTEERQTWTEKERREQQIVEDYLTTTLKANGVKKVKPSPPQTFSTGPLEHICSTVSGLIESKNWTAIIDQLHPTPALCGFPKLEAKKFIEENEALPRELYGGYLGEVSESSADLFVNIRCIRLGINGIRFFAGAGINSGSDPEKEWRETESKMGVMMAVLERLRS